jgi:hypothetical protein
LALRALTPPFGHVTTRCSLTAQRSDEDRVGRFNKPSTLLNRLQHRCPFGLSLHGMARIEQRLLRRWWGWRLTKTGGRFVWPCASMTIDPPVGAMR